VERRSRRIFGFPHDEALGTSMDIIIPERLRARHWADWEAALRTDVTT
jgi:hypothetical protein